jgi:hypothetical protein
MDRKISSASPWEPVVGFSSRRAPWFIWAHVPHDYGFDITSGKPDCVPPPQP